MVNIYEQADYDKALKLKNRLLTAYFIALGVCFAVCLTLFILFLQLPFASTREIEAQKNGYLVAVCVITSVFIAASFLYLCIPFKRARAYFRLMDDIKTGQKVENEATFLQNEEEIRSVRDVDFRYMVVLEWSEKTQEYMRRNVLVDKEKEMPVLNNGDIIVYVTHANVLLSYGLKSERDIFGGDLA